MKTAAVGLWLAVLAFSQTEKSAGLSAEQILECSIEATGGREAYAKLASTVAKGVLEFEPQHLHGAIEFYAKAPNKRLVITRLENIGEILQGFDGQVAWMSNPMEGRVVRVEGAEAERIRREADFHRPLRWRELYTKVELAGKQTVDGRATYVVRLTPRQGKPLTHYYDAESFLLVRQDLVQQTTQGELPVQALLSDYRDVDGIKVPFRIEQQMPMGKMVIVFHEIRNNVVIEDARFAMPAESKP